MKMMMIMMMMMVVTLFAFLSFFTKKKPLQKRETEINCAKRLTPLSLCCDSQLVKKEGKRCLCLFTLKRIKTDARHARINMNPE